MAAPAEEPGPLEATVETTKALSKGCFVRWFMTLFPRAELAAEGEWLPTLLGHARMKEGGMVWATGQQEMCPETGRRHAHVIMSFDTARTFSQVSRLFPGCQVWSVKIGRTDADVQRIITYCRKDETREAGPWMHGEVPSKRGEKRSTAWADALTMIQDGKTDAEVAQLLPHVAQSSGFDRLRSRLSRPRSTREPPTVILLHGPTGTGKTRAAYALADARGWTIVSIPTWTGGGKVWWNGYQQQHVLLLDDMMPVPVSMAGYWLQVLDRYPMIVEFKGGAVDLNSPIIIVTSNHALEALTDGWPEANQAAFARRFTHQVVLLEGEEEENNRRIAEVMDQL